MSHVFEYVVSLELRLKYENQIGHCHLTTTHTPNIVFFYSITINFTKAYNLTYVMHDMHHVIVEISCTSYHLVRIYPSALYLSDGVTIRIIYYDRLIFVICILLGITL